MTKFTATIASAAALLFAGSAFAQMPAAGEGPLFQNETRISVSAESAPRSNVSIQQVASGEQSGVVQSANDVNSPSRAEVREQTREAIARGDRPAVGNRS